MPDPRLELIVHHFHPPSGAKLWHGGPTVRGALRGVSAEVAAWKPAPERHSIWDLTLHVAYWNYAVNQRITGGAKGRFPRSPSNFPSPPEEGSEAAWRRDRALLDEWHRRLLATLRGLDPGRLDDPVGKGTYTVAELGTGIVLHDVYHTGQIQMLKRLWAERDAL